ncbi:MAG TPA: TIM barrel protein, partial [Rectinemataceae bacterium]|nr:TIM barrel protein [Rectinemataceae bacterium]
MMKYSVCNELFGSMPLADVCRIARKSGFSGIEFAPFTVFGNFSAGDIAGGVAATRRALDFEGLAFVGFHWLMAKPDGLHLASLDPAVKKRSRDHLARLLEAAGELGGGALILGSPKQ